MEISGRRRGPLAKINSQNIGNVPISWELLMGKELLGKGELLKTIKSRRLSYSGARFTSDASRFTSHAFDAQLLHPRFERGGIQSEDLGRALLAAHAPVGLLQHIDDMLPFHFLERQGLS